MVLLLADSSSVYHLFHLSPLLLVFSCGRNRGKANGKIQLDKATKEFDALATAATKAEAKATELKAKVWGGAGEELCGWPRAPPKHDFCSNIFKSK